MDGTIIGQGTFLSQFSGVNPNTGVASNQAADAIIIPIPSGVDWMYVYNYTKAGANGLNSVYFQGTANAFAGVEYYWQRGMAAGTGIVKYKSNAASTLNEDTMVTGGFTLYDPTGQDLSVQPRLGPSVVFTAITDATRPVVTTASTAGISVGSVVRLQLLTGDTALANDVTGIDFVVGAVTLNTNFTLLFAGNALANVPGLTTGTGHWRLVNFDDYFYPRKRVITSISQAVNAQVCTAIAHGLTPGQEVRFAIPAVSGMVELDSSTGTLVSATIVTVVDLYCFTIDIDTTAYTAFSYPTVAQQPSSFPVVAPVGEDTGFALTSPTIQVPGVVSSTVGQQIFNTQTGILADATVNTAFLGMILGAGGNGLALTTPISGPGGTVHFTAANAIDVRDRMYWVAGKSTYGGL